MGDERMTPREYYDKYVEVFSFDQFLAMLKVRKPYSTEHTEVRLSELDIAVYELQVRSE